MINCLVTLNTQQPQKTRGETTTPPHIQHTTQQGSSTVQLLLQFPVSHAILPEVICNININMASIQAIQKLSQQIFGHLPNMHMRTGNKFLKKRFTGIIEARYYPDSITPIAKKVSVYFWIQVLLLFFDKLLTPLYKLFSDLSRLLDGTRRSPYGEVRPASTKRKRASEEGKWEKEEEIVCSFSRSCCVFCLDLHWKCNLKAWKSLAIYSKEKHMYFALIMWVCMTYIITS